VELLPTSDDLWFVVVTLPEKISTAWAYAKFDELIQATGAHNTDACSTNLYDTDAYDTSVAATCATSKMIRAMRTGKAQDIAERLSDANDLERAAVSIIPSIAGVKQALLAAGAAGVGMSGSGPTVFGLTDSRGEGSRNSWRAGEDVEGRQRSFCVSGSTTRELSMRRGEDGMHGGCSCPGRRG